MSKLCCNLVELLLPRERERERDRAGKLLARTLTRAHLCGSSLVERAPANERRPPLHVAFSCLKTRIHRHARAHPSQPRSPRADTRASPRDELTAMAEGGEGEDEIQFLRTVSRYSVAPRGRRRARCHCGFLLGCVCVCCARACV